ncbi:MAG TPA: SUMF1/EgtB/PvdO family nonheme iron enzyme [Acidobacteriota bacterium]|nr:SUMF1/EgtB/PvdO family nonheme iron enzyme [Acidobacteriota bacterium]
MRYAVALCLCLFIAADGLAAAADGIEMVRIPRGTFTMGSEEDLSKPIATNKPAHRITISAFKMGMYEVTNQQFAEYLNAAELGGQIEVRDDLPATAHGTGIFVLGASGYPSAGQKIYHLGGTNLDGESELNIPWIAYDEGAVLGMRFQVLDSQDLFGNNDALDTTDWPATFVPWHGAAAFAAFNDYALPTEAQWEYASQGGVGNDYGTDDGTLSLVNANYSGQAAPGGIAAGAVGHVVAVGSYPANPFGLNDLAGNAWEWTADNYDGQFCANTEGATDPFSHTGIDGTSDNPEETVACTGGPNLVCNCNTRLKRGGSWNFHAVTIRSQARNTDYPYRGNDHFGFRVVGALSKPNKPGKLAAEIQDDGSVLFSWDDKSDDESFFELDCKGKGKWAHVAKVGANVDQVTSEALGAGTKYKCRLRARNSAGKSGWKRKKIDLR